MRAPELRAILGAIEKYFIVCGILAPATIPQAALLPNLNRLLFILIRWVVGQTLAFAARARGMFIVLLRGISG